MFVWDEKRNHPNPLNPIANRGFKHLWHSSVKIATPCRIHQWCILSVQPKTGAHQVNKSTPEPKLSTPLKSNGNWYPTMMGRMEKVDYVVLNSKIWPFFFTSMLLLDFWGVKNGGLFKMIFFLELGDFAGSTAQFSRVKHAKTHHFSHGWTCWRNQWIFRCFVPPKVLTAGTWKWWVSIGVSEIPWADFHQSTLACEVFVWCFDAFWSRNLIFLLRQLCLNAHENKPGSQEHQSL